ncbi:MAG: exodeoxyribonuclease I [Comamonas sp. SCN 67-35]|uniref:exodeoxyribonuclease I n=1 Tax=unclassified Comamonas TaxID=2638500 RepID=UPI00086EBB66|nr:MULTISPECIES: exodeoxyribonuclease I [unclassified Comamonas]MBN9331259.1 exodeoxyribonuclease I [Comamonas sp.]ODU37551.1 MAG: exodeoxyribonuclease I [Comamonas sp. SCN 67-35]OJX02433.1 MAG: exodeoxyribonuclease I [Burkholderiales bacterium 66-26]
MHTFLWHDYETFGTDTRRDRPAQFAAIRTDAELREIGEPVMLYCRPTDDYLPDPGACLITGITPQQCLAHGVPEHAFAARIEAELAQAGTIGVGYNTIRFDDEVTRFMFWRNLIDPYAREWQNQCGRWDLLDVVRLAYALRPDGITWPVVDGKPSFRLEKLTQANGIAHEAAHDALSDVRATIALARLIRQHNPRLFDFALSLHKKERVAQELRLPATQSTAKPFLHVSGMFPAERGCLALMWPLAMHPTNKNELLAWDLAHDPGVLAGLSVPELRERLFTRADERPEGVARLPIKGVHLNKSPMVVGHLNTLTPALARKWGIDVAQAMQHAEIARALPDMNAIWPAVYARPDEPAPDVDQDLYGGFLGNEDRRRLTRLRGLAAAELAQARAGFDDARLAELLFRYRARNFPETLTTEEQARWQAHRVATLMEGEGGARTFDALFAQLDALGEQADERAGAILEAIYDYAEAIAPDMG